MTTTYQIEQRLGALSGPRFQRLCDAYLRQRGIESYLSIGLTVGRDQTRAGTPDSVAADPNGHTFVEMTTQVAGLGGKLLDDVKKCLDPSKTGVPIERIRAIYLFFTGHLNADEIEALFTLTRPQGVALKLHGPHELADDLRYRFASLAREYLDLAVDTGQVLDPETFVQRHASTAIQTDLDARLVGRDNELATITRHLGEVARPVVLLTGPAGVGKTRLALATMRRASIAANPTTVLCVRSRGADPAADLRAALERPGRYLILLDDANRLVNLTGLLDSILEAREDHDVRVVITVRDYVADNVRRLLRERGEVEVVGVGALNDQELRTLLVNTFGIVNDRYQRRILEIASGNARLAVMAARVVLATQDLGQLHDATDVYRRFFDPLQRECPILATSEGRRALGAVALVGHLDITQTELAGAVARVHALEPAAFRATLEALDDLELVDLYENELARVSDQTLAAYVLFLAVFEHRELSLMQALLELYPRVPTALVEALGGVVRAFRGNEVSRQLNEAVNAVWDQAARDWPPQLFDRFVLTFADVRPAEALTRAVSQLSTVSAEPAPAPGPVAAAISFQASADDGATLLLGRFRHDEALRTTALRELVAEARRRPSRISILLRLAWERYGFAADTDWGRLDSENSLVNVLWEEAAQDEQIAAPMFIAVAGRALQTDHDAFSSGRGNSITVSLFQVPTTNAVGELRDKLWRRLVVMLGTPALRPVVQTALATYARGGLRVKERAIVARDLTVLEPLLFQALDPGDTRDLALVRVLRQLRERFNLGIPPSYAPFLRTPQARLGELLLRDPTQAHRLGWQAAAARRSARLDRFGSQINAARLTDLPGEAAALLAVHTDHDAYQIREGVTRILVAAAKSKPAEVTKLVRVSIAGGNPLNLPPSPIVHGLTQATGLGATWELVTTAAPAPARDPWVVAWLQLLPPESWTRNEARIAAELLQRAPAGEIGRIRYLVDQICAVDAQDGAAVLRHLVARISTQDDLAHGLGFEFYDGSALAGPMGDVLRSHPDILGDLYLALDAAEQHFDPLAIVLDTLLTLDQGFGARWLDRVLGAVRRLAIDEHRDYTALWRRDDWETVVGALARHILANDRGTRFATSFLQVFLRAPSDTNEIATVARRQDALLGALIRETVQEADLRRRLFTAIAHLPAERRRDLVGVYLALEPSVEDLIELTLEPTTWGWTGSEVPVLEKRRAFFESLLPLCDRPSLLPHRAELEERLRHFDVEIASARRADFRDLR